MQDIITDLCCSDCLERERDIANRTNLYKPGFGFPDDVIKHVKPIYLDLIQYFISKRNS